MKRLITGFAFLAMSFSVMAAPVNGAFGYNIGQAVNVSSLQPISDGNSDPSAKTASYSITPLDQNNSFTDYSITVNNQDSKIVAINATKNFVNSDSCINSLNEMKKMLNKQYSDKVVVGNPAGVFIMDNSNSNSLQLGCADTTMQISIMTNKM